MQGDDGLKLLSKWTNIILELVYYSHTHLFKELLFFCFVAQLETFKSS